ncbi:MAG: ATP-binding cassette domain-containing protein, partial [Eubacterium sp.]|nr:ATP-binding cassette domain-containing protein [Eubacterium sp.]
KVKKYSMGMRQRLAIAQAIMEDQDIILLDEPMNSLDQDGVKEMRELLLYLKDQGKSILLASHYAEDIQYLCDKVYRISHGELIIDKDILWKV